ncbi:MAG TPA: M48 family metallopeptidase [Terriglobales bacterium]|nr:M48 family metallopeptidase [Terriglobales bacterium]
MLCSALLLCAVAFTQNSPSSDSTSSTSDQKSVKTYHDGSIRDIDAIGNRNIGCQRSIGNWYSLEKQIAMGRSYSQQVESTSKLISDPVINEYVNRVGQNLVRNSDALVPFTIKVLDTDDINAFALPGGFFYVDSGLILAADNEAELAGVMAHEIAHVAACHAAREISRGQLMNLASIPLIFVGGGIGYAAQSLAGLAVPLGFMKFSRGFESEADFLGVEYLYKAGYDPQALTSFFEKVKAMEKQKPGTLAKAFDTHPQTPDRIARTQREINTLLPAEPEYKLDTSEFEDIKARLAQLENRHKLNPSHGGDGPTLRRASHAPVTDTQTADDADQHPTLKRRTAPDSSSGPDSGTTSSGSSSAGSGSTSN